MLIIDGHEYTLYKDYDRVSGKYKHLSFLGKVTYLDARVRHILIDPLRRIAPDLAQTELGLVFTTAICAGISAAGTYLKGRRAQPGRDKDSDFFLDFVRAYMDSGLREPEADGKTWAEWLYHDVRCGLAHNFTIMKGGIEVQVTQYVELTPNGPEMNPAHFLEDFAKGWTRYLSDVAAAGSGNGLGLLFEQRFNEVFND